MIKSFDYSVCAMLLGFGFGVMSAESRAATEALESQALRVELNTSPYSYRVIERTTGDPLVLESGKISFTENQYAVRNASDVTRGDCSMRATLHLEGTSEPAKVSFTFIKPEILQVILTFKDSVPAEMKEEFTDQGEHYYGESGK